VQHFHVSVFILLYHIVLIFSYSVLICEKYSFIRDVDDPVGRKQLLIRKLTTIELVVAIFSLKQSILVKKRVLGLDFCSSAFPFAMIWLLDRPNYIIATVCVFGIDLRTEFFRAVPLRSPVKWDSSSYYEWRLCSNFASQWHNLSDRGVNQWNLPLNALRMSDSFLVDKRAMWCCWRSKPIVSHHF
jgi:hypothetical protein